jgi:3-hydroxyisobutyrate dehydrogenase-like beta-hydroxyacid dehydrogenase
MAEPLRAGVIGIGAMGMSVAKRLLDRGFTTCVRDIRPEAEAHARAAGATVCATAAEVGRACTAVITLVVDAAQTEEVLFGRDGLAEGLRPDATHFMCSTIPPAAAEGFAARLRERGLEMIDAPCSGGPARARSGEMTLMVAAPAATLARQALVIAAISGRCFHVSERAGDGSRAKIVNNMLAGVNLAAGSEAMALAIKLGLDARTMSELIGASSGGSWVFADRMPRVLAGDYAPRAALDILKKDLSILLETAAQARCPTPLARAAHAIFEDAARLGLGGEDDAALIKVYQRLTGIRLPGEDER